VKSIRTTVLSLIALTSCVSLASAAESGHGIKKGDKFQTLGNLHPDSDRHRLYTLNYQLPALIPVCSEVTVTKVASKEISFTWQGTEYEIKYDNFTKEAGVSFDQAFRTYFGPACDKAKMEKLGAPDQEGIRLGRAKVGMTRDGVLFAMGRPPVHANPDLTAAEWRYWRNRYGTQLITFDSSDKVTEIR
jgi:hypothetical protein